MELVFSVGAAIINSSRVLLLQRSGSELHYPNRWELSGGKVEDGESLEQALLREVREETGLAIRPIQPLQAFDYEVVSNGQPQRFRQHNFLAEPVDAEPVVQLSAEHQAFAWVSKDDLERYDCSEEVREVAAEALSEIQP